MIKINKFTNSRSILQLEKVLDKRRGVIQNTNIAVVSKILKDIRKNKNKALIKYEKKFSKNSRIKPSSREINKAITSLNPKVKKIGADSRQKKNFTKQQYSNSFKDT